MMNDTINASPMRLHEFLRNELENILDDWRKLGKLKIAASRDLSDKQQRNRISELLEGIAASSEEANNSTDLAKLPLNWPKHHAEQRWDLGFTLEETTREYGLLRDVVFRRLTPHINELTADEIVFLNAALDESIIQAVIKYVSIANQRLASERERLEVTLQSIGDGVVSTGPEGLINYMNSAAQTILGWSLDEAMGKLVNDVMITLDETTHKRLKCAALWASEKNEITHRGPGILLQRADGELIPAEETAAPLRNDRGEFMGAVTTFRDISKLKSLTQRLGYLSAYDSLTGLPNRALFVDRLYQALAHAKLHELNVVVFHLDLDQFKDVNDMLGRSGGDELLKQIGKRLTDCIRLPGTVCRVSSDEFILFLSEVKNKESVKNMCNSIHENIRRPFNILSQDVRISASVGISMFPSDGQDPHTLIKNAETATKHAKAEGRNIGRFFNARLNQQAETRRQLQTELKKAMAAGQLSLHFQPQVCLDSGKTVGAEALLRWTHPELGEISPGQFIPIAEQDRELMLEIGDWVLEEACRQVRAWQDADYEPMRVSVNISLAQLHDDTLINRIKYLLQRYLLQPDLLQLELTESLLMSDIVGASERVNALKALGLHISIDDFGTGYSSLSYLQELPVDELKIDQSFLRDLASNRDKTLIVQGIISLGKSLAIRILAEGIEDQYTANFLKECRCDYVQGFFYSKAIPADSFEVQYLSRPEQ